MGTHCLTIFVEPAVSGTNWEDESWSQPEQEIVVMYHHFDGYLAGVGVDLATFLVGEWLTDGKGLAFNGMSDLAAQAVAYFKCFHPPFKEKVAEGMFRSRDWDKPPEWGEPGPYDTYLHAAGTRDIGEEYIYRVLNTDDGIMIEATRLGSKYSGTTDKTVFITPEDLLVRAKEIELRWQNVVNAEYEAHSEAEGRV
jgi:hypothetical protein